jgi:hypothetical protein
VIVVSINYGGNVEGLLATPNVYTRLDEVDLFADVMEGIARQGLPA